MQSRHYTILLVILGLLAATPQLPGQSTSLRDIFEHPPEAAKPRGYWIWGHGNYDYSRMKEELRAFKEMGLGGVDIFDMGIADPYGIIPAGNPFMGEKMLDGIVFAVNEAKKLDLPLGFSVSNGWNAGGDWTEPDEMIMRLLFWKDTIQGPVTLSEIGFPEIPTTFQKPYGTFELFPQVRTDGFPEYYEDVGLVAYPLSDNPLIKDPDRILYFDVNEIKGNTVEIKLPRGQWVLSRAVVSPLGQKMWMRSDNSRGFIMDHYSKKATKHHFEHVIGKLEERIGDLGASPLERLYLCSFEAEDYIIWSPELRQTFFEQHGYSLDPYIPVFAGQQIVDQETTDRFLHDYRSTVSEMFVNNHYRQARAISNAHGLQLASESGGPGPPLHYVPTEDMKALGAVDIMRGEFWNKKSEYFDENGNDLLQVVRNIASAAHIYGRSIVEMESFTSHEKHWQESPLELKRLADLAFCQGMTRVIYHTMPHSPKEAGVPGWSYQAGTHISPKMTWWDQSRPFHSYLARTSALLQAGRFVADVAYYYGEQIPNFASGSKFIRKTLGPGYDYDDLNKEILLQASVTDDGQLQLPSGMQYRLLVLPDDPQMSLEVLQKIEELLQAGATILGPRPQTVPGLSDYQKKEKTLRTLADKIWGKKARQQKRSYGKGTLITGFTEREILLEKGILPDLEYQGGRLDYIHRTLGEEEVYFIRNLDSIEVQSALTFRSDGKQPYQFDPVSGEIRPLAIFTENEGRTHLPLVLEGYGSTFVVLLNELLRTPYITQVRRDGAELFPGTLAHGIEAFFDKDGEVRFRANSPGLYQLIFSDGSYRNFRRADESIVPLDGSWAVHFPHGWGFDPIRQFDQLINWAEHDDPELAIFSGTGTYHQTFTLEPDFLTADRNYILDLGEVGTVATVYLNGHEVGTRVFPPYRFELGDLLRPGENTISIDVTNSWLNQLIGEAEKPLAEQRTRSNLGGGLKKPANRPWRGYEPEPAGLMGPVRVLATPVSK
ncbi:glycosyl hydrolase [Flavilitoribacter nigricans]|uniref:Beta-mannosidase-like galactose-binding domain-containing protein n=1 Tax=Flavilitoribacter nigricans (strain ATCC 23147 / DSM 23189 / NBRC 102662 / NCIMB 1420 / SS-2) TaxID=1122177 RepID=A0A2D0NI94_FLAN2|nr:glycosyl hydrolase [Flavilitoribacter nigricans]PHN08158.1 hypothetical protein CRP01_02220 [Flavilitoribacter nigricans DSM 23189 = NBRC 102662]